MRNEFVRFLLDRNQEKTPTAPNFVFVTADLGFSVLEPLRDQLGPRFINSGVAEALMTTLAASIASYGVKTFTYSIIPFVTLRCLEQIRNDICYHKNDVTIVSVGAGYGYGTLGPSHHAIDDLAAMWALPHLKVYHPGDLNEAQACFENSWLHPGPKYLRLSKGGDTALSQINLSGLKNESIVEYSKGDSVTLLCTGNILAEVLKAVEHQPGVQVLSCPILKPFPEEELIRKTSSRKILIVEELSRYGGFSGQCAKVYLSQRPIRSKKPLQIFTLSAPDEFSKVVGSTDYQRKLAGLDHESIRKELQRILEI